ncbi:3-isopropylmalate dehydrogenase [Salisediminibacterium halotolerans]|uniref:3-isopropylmalate dehydrogenase n=1 Tax=Salisediminibacterium halotolerans TaxID=517425 RepID=UPI000EAD086F|nr:3-isopropylmalate dehydrogenase [Salisediminibacterium halotolerans]RLJ72355.1 3-isopropylmalate dehydrogenase [Actinophytocola xinjiangensis]RPE85569.1 3-isopropylmalate dehydrogenase [Salisediminibacterium halotolerans]TWG33524.1 3-isopropylmalate dehydrogenase [Salisediminibacterium halotolerans]GEL08831.1 3-isopropylmalate dehydrogenase [Salisediminibacterium halotolerans]
MKKNIVLLPGDGIGEEVTASAQRVLDAVAHQFNHTFTYQTEAIGGAAIDEFGTPLPEATETACHASDAVLLGAVGGPKWDENPSHLRPEKGLLGIRKSLGLFANLRPVQGFAELLHASPLKHEVVNDSDLLIVRELTGGLYFGTPSERRNDGTSVVDTLAYERSEIERIVRKGFEAASVRRKQLTSVDKANVLESSKMWREVVNEIAPEYTDVTVEHMLVDAAAMKLITAPTDFDVIVTENMFGDILSDEASVLTGSLGMLPSASLREDGFGLYEPVHGSAPDIAGQGLANPFATILSAAMMLRYSFAMQKEAETIEKAVDSVLKQGYHTGDLNVKNGQKVGTKEITDYVIEMIEDHSATESIKSCYA